MPKSMRIDQQYQTGGESVIVMTEKQPLSSLSGSNALRLVRSIAHFGMDSCPKKLVASLQNSKSESPIRSDSISLIQYHCLLQDSHTQNNAPNCRCSPFAYEHCIKQGLCL